MKRILYVAITFLFGLALVACGEATTAAPTTAAPTTAAPTTAAPTTAAPTTTAPTTTAPTTAAPTTQEAAVLGVIYSGTHTVSAMGGMEIIYNYTMTFIEGEYEFYSTYEMGGAPYDFEETGTYTLEGSVLAITPSEGTAIAGTLNQDGSIEVSVKPSEMGERALRTLDTIEDLSVKPLNKGTHTVSAMGGDIVYVYSISFAEGNYALESFYEMGGSPYSYVETGTYSVSGNVLTMTPEAGTAAEGVVHVNGSIEAPVKPSEMGERALRTLNPMDEFPLEDEYEGTHTVSAMGGEVVYTYTLTFTDGNYAFASNYVMGETPYNYQETGTYSVSGNVLTLDPATADPMDGLIHVNGSIDAPIKASSQADRALHLMTPVEEVVE